MNFKVSNCNDFDEVDELKIYFLSIDNSLKNNLVFNFSEGKYYKIQFGNDLIGFASVVDEDYSFVDLKRFIHPEHRHKGASEALLDFIIQDAKNSNKTRLTGSFLGNNEKATNFFKSKGFKVTNGQSFSIVVLSLK